ncbi:MAG: sodium:proton exchanger [Tenericutes bacterium HGW-Tenericutes-5]|nr:MAG: sodium:proton exchanger [Tenericutes bacterium HGW-Tenericutes-5]
MSYLLLIVGFVLLVKGADLFVEGSSKLAKILRIPPIIIGLTIVAFGTSTPEAAVSISASINGSEGISLGNVIGSNLVNISLILGLTTVITPMIVQKKTIVKEIPLALLGSVALLVMLLDTSLTSETVNSLSRTDGIILLLFFGVFVYYIVEVAIKNKNNQKIYFIEKDDKKPSVLPSLLKLFIGLGGLVLGGWLVVKYGQEIALSLGMSETLVGLTIVAIGTSLPELVTSVTAALKKESEIALGNIIGSNIFNIMFVLGISSTINPITISSNIVIDIVLMIMVTFVVMIFATTHKRKINRIEGSVLLAIYLAYLTFIIIRN